MDKLCKPTSDEWSGQVSAGPAGKDTWSRRRSVEYRTSAEAVARAERDAEKFAGVVAITMAIDTDTGEVVEEPKVLARFGEVGREFQEE